MLIHRMTTKQQVKNDQIKRKQICSLCFVNAFCKFQKNELKIVQKIFQEIKILIKKRFLAKATGHNNHYMINMGKG